MFLQSQLMRRVSAKTSECSCEGWFHGWISSEYGPLWGVIEKDDGSVVQYRYDDITFLDTPEVTGAAQGRLATEA